MRRADGTTFPALLNATSVHDELGRTVACNASILNITELVNARKKLEVTMQELMLKETKLQEVNEELKRVERAKEEFLSLVSHELKNPLTPIIGFSDMLRKQAATSKAPTDAHIEAIKIINNSANEMRRLIDDILAVYKLDMRLEFVFKEQRILDLIDQVTNEMASILQEKGIAVERFYRLDNEYEGVITCDALRVRQVLVNLIRNSIDFVPNSGGRIRITVENKNDAGSRMIEISVADNGSGVPVDKRSGLFRKFYQVYSNTTRRHGGTGLGLTICKEIIEMHGGKIWYDDEYAGGACFRFVLPMIPVATSKGSAA
jgi:signal transduction histidine kinase